LTLRPLPLKPALCLALALVAAPIGPVGASAAPAAEAPGAPEGVEAVRALAEEGDVEGALARSEGLLGRSELGPAERAQVHLARADLFDTQGRLDRVAEETAAAVALRPDDVDLQLRLGRVYVRKVDWEHAERAFERALELDPKRVEAHVELGRIHAKRHRTPDALRHLEAATKLDPHNLAAHEQLALVYERSGRTELAIIEWERCIDLDPGGKVAGKAKRHISRLRERR